MTIIDRISDDLMMNPDEINHIAMTADIRYRRITLYRPGKEPRHVWQPSSELRLIQRWCADKIFCFLPVHTSCFSYVKKRNIAKHAEVHKLTNYLARIDIRHFFPSIHRHNVISLLARYKNALHVETDSDIDTMSRIATRRDALVIGSPSSPVISNAIMFSFDSKWEEICRNCHVIYSRYADDIYISSLQPGILSGLLIELKRDLESMPQFDFVINAKKDVFTSRKRLQRVTGIIITSDHKLSIGRSEKRKIKGQIYKALNHILDPNDVQKLLGKLSYIDDVEPTFSRSLILKYGEAFREELTAIVKTNQAS
jgi:hypothetical protein